MDLFKMAQEVVAVVQEECSDFEELVPASEDSAVWGFIIDEDTSGFVFLDANLGTFDVATVTISLSLGTLEDITKDDLLELLSVNGELLGASLTITPPFGDEQEEFLMLQTKFLATEFSKTMFVNSLNSLVAQISLFFAAE